MATVVYVACALTSGACAGLLVRAYRRDPSSVLRWTAAYFVLLALLYGLRRDAGRAPG